MNIYLKCSSEIEQIWVKNNIEKILNFILSVTALHMLQKVRNIFYSNISDTEMDLAYKSCMSK